ncbi:hypothetical protein QE152_g34214 [Popillia japonica]|uniref:Uncharacterized protein n=1 Tax=Popillia japonica TaxID=7064 RepID=A0AAW1ITP2_POPJA
MNQLQEDLLRQLREGLAQDAYRQSSSFSSSGTSYEPVMSHGSYGVGSNAYRTSYSSGSAYRQRQSYSSGGECCMQSDDSTTVSQETVAQQKTRVDLAEKNESQNSESVDIEAVPDENVETSTRTLARDKPSNKPKPQEQIPQSGDLSQHQQHWDQNINEDQDQLTQQETLGQVDQNLETVGQLFDDDDTTRITQESVQQQNSGRNDQNRYHGGGSSYSGRQQNKLFTQQNEFLTHEREIPERYIGYQPNPVQKLHHLVQQNLTKLKDNLDQHSYIFNLDQTDDLTQHTDQLTQHTDQLTQYHDDLTQQNEELTQQNEDLTQQSYYPSQTQDFTQQSQNSAQRSEDLTQNAIRSGKASYLYPYDLPKNTDDLTQQNEDFTQQNEDLTQQTEDLTQQTEDLTQQI